MSSKEINGFFTITQEPKSDSEPQTTIQAGNVSFKHVSLRRTISFWDTNLVLSDARLIASPFKNNGLVLDEDTVGHSFFSFSPGADYPSSPTGSPVAIATADYSKFRSTGTIGTVPNTGIPRVFGSIMAQDAMSGVLVDFGESDCLISTNDVPLDYTQIGTVWQHPAHMQLNTINTSITAGTSYITFTNTQFWDQRYFYSGCFNLIRIESGADKGFYYAQSVDFVNNRLYLRNLNGTVFQALATATSLTATACPGRRAFFNEVGIIQLSVGTIQTGGRFNPRKADPHLRGSFIMRMVFDKTGSTEAAVGTEQQGSYYITILPFTHGYGTISDTTLDVFDSMPNSLATRSISTSSPELPPGFNFFDGGASAISLDWESQRVWFGYTNASNQSGIGHWRYKTCESFREVANYLGTAGHASFLTPTITLGAGDMIRGSGIGSNRWVYFAIGHASGGNAGLAIIKPDLTTLQYKLADGIPSSVVAGIAVDKSRARLGTAGDVVTTVSTGNLSSASGAFTNADIGRAIKVTGATADNATYKILSVTSGTVVVVQTLAGGAVSFAGGTGGSFEIGDRVYMFFNNATTGNDIINYMESLAPGTFLSRSSTMTNAANCNVYVKPGEQQKVVVDQANGNVYWLSNDTQQQINKYEVLTNTHTFRTIANILSPSGGAPANPGSPTVFTAIHVNSKFNEIWVGSDFGHIKLVKNDFAGANFKRYFGTESTTYVNPTGFPRPSGTLSTGVNSNYVRNYYEHADGRMETFLSPSTTAISDIALYSHESDNWQWRSVTSSASIPYDATVITYVRNAVHDPYGTSFSLRPALVLVSSSNCRAGLHPNEIQYQWDNIGSKWIPLEVVQTNLPNKSISDTFSPGCVAKPIHSGFEEVLFGVKVKFTSAGSPNNDFLGRAGQTRVTSSDGSTSIGLATFTGSGFVAGDTDRILHIESGADIGIYKMTFVNATSVTLKTMSGATFSAAATAGSLVYTVWDFGTPGSNAGPENASVLLADGFGKDNFQDITGMTYEAYNFKTRLHDNDEPIKFAVENPLAVPGSIATKMYYETYARATPQYDAALSHHRALPGAEHTNGRQLFDWILDKYLDGNTSRALVRGSPIDNTWAGVAPNVGALGCSPMVDFGKDVQLGHVQVRAHSVTFPTVASGVLNTITGNGLICNLYKVNHADGTPAASSVIRTSGVSNVFTTINNTTITTSGSFLGSVTISSVVGVISAGQSVLTDSTNPFLASHLNQILDITVAAGSPADVGAYRIIAVAIGGESVTIRNLDQTSKTWIGSSGGVNYSVRDGVREEDMIAIPSLAVPTHKLCVERLLSSTTAQVRTAPNATVSGLSWDCVKPSWTKVKRLSFNSEALPPDESNNNTWISADGREQYVLSDWKAYFDLADLSSSQKTGRYWKLSLMPRFATDSNPNSEFDFSTLEFFDPSGNKLAVSKYTQTDESRTNVDFLCNHINRFDILQSSNSAMTGVAGINGNVNLGGAEGDTLTLTTGGNKFLGYRIGPITVDGELPSGTNLINSLSSSFPTSSILGRFVRILTGANAGNIYRVTSRPLSTQIVLSTLSGGAFTWAGLETGIQFTIHEGVAAGGAYPDKIRFTSDDREFTIATINDAATSITISEIWQAARTNQAWEIIRPGYDTTSATTEAAKTARLVRPQTTYPVQSGDMAHDSRGAYRFFAEDVGFGYQRADGSVGAPGNVFTGTNFSSDDLGRLMYITTGSNIGIYEITTPITPTSVTVKDHYTGAVAALLADAGPITYQIYGDRRFRISKLVVSLRA